MNFSREGAKEAKFSGLRLLASGLGLLVLAGCASAPKQTIDLKVPVPVYDYAK